MLNGETKRKIKNARDILVGKIPVPTTQVEQITLALMYKFMSDMDEQAKKLGDKTGFFMDEFEKYSWKNITDTSLSAYDRVALYSEGLEKMNNNPNVPQLFRDIFKGAFLPFKDPETLKLFLDQINEIEYTHSEDLGDAYESLLSIMGSQGDAGQFRTPRHIIDFIVEIVDPKKEDRILDPACGTAGFLISAYKHILKQNTSKDSKILGDTLSPMDRRNLTKNFVGYDISPDMRRLSLVNMYLHQFPDPQVYEYDTLTSTDHWDEDFDCILANPPFMTPRGGIRPHKRFAIQANKSEILFVDYIMSHLSTTGKAGIIVPEGIISNSSSNAYKNLRKLLVDDNYLWAVISLPAGVFQPYSGVKTSVLLLDKNIAKKTDGILFTNVKNDGFDLGAQREEIDKNDLPEILNSLGKYKELILNDKGVKEDELFNTNIIGKSRIKESGDYNLSGNRYQSSERDIYVKGKWPEVQLKEICELKKGSSITKKDIKEGNVPVIAGGQNPAYFHNESNRAGETITVSSSGAYSGFVNYFDIPIWASDCTTIKPLSNSKISTKYLYYILKFKQSDIYNLQQGMGQPHVYAKDLEKIQIPLPPIEEQKKIVEELDRYQRIIDGAKMVIDNWRPEIEIDPNWNTVILGNEFKIESGGTPNTSIAEYWDGDIKWATLVDIPESITGISETKRRITREGLKNSSAKLLPKGTVLVSTRATIGRIGVAEDEIATNQGFKNVIVEKDNNPYFVAYMLKTKLPEMILLASGGTFKEISKTNFATIQIPLPSKNIQDQIINTIMEKSKIVDLNKKLIEEISKIIDEKIASLF
ncbi:MAG TPA: N-6 DNA methylase [Candidatus Dojkabacteria bacterium]|nr:N-6 DNA methylase [Candidatus Dojkabacteria bacterium]